MEREMATTLKRQGKVTKVMVNIIKTTKLAADTGRVRAEPDDDE